jgi:arylsulfatase A-like enzyme
MFLRFQGMYAAAVAHFDTTLDTLFKELEGRGLLEEVLLILTSDHGLSLGEHGVIGLPQRLHMPHLREELVHLPLMMRLPKGDQAGRRVPALTQPVDLAPTLLDAFGLPPAEMHGHSLLQLARGTAAKVRDYACTTSWTHLAVHVECALRSPEWTFVVRVNRDASRTGKLYVRPDDRWELNDVAQHHPERVDQLGAVLFGFLEAARQPGPLRPPELRDVEARDASQPTAESSGDSTGAL